MNDTPEKNDKDQRFDWHEEGVAILVRLVILGWSGAILTLNYITIPGLPQQKIDPTFIASIFTGTLATFGVTATKKDNNGNGNGNSQPVPSRELPQQKRRDLREED